MDANITLMQAVLLGMWYWIITCSFGYSFGESDTAGMPIICSLPVGIILGDMRNTLMIAALLQPMYLAFTSAGGTVAQDRAAATIVSCTVLSNPGCLLKHRWRWLSPSAY